MSLDKEAKIQAIEKRLEKMDESILFLKELLTHLNKNIEELKNKK
jgi:prefoldin subunit 5